MDKVYCYYKSALSLGLSRIGLHTDDQMCKAPSNIALFWYGMGIISKWISRNVRDLVVVRVLDDVQQQVDAGVGGVA